VRLSPSCRPIHNYQRAFRDPEDGHYYPKGAISKKCLVKGCKCKKPLDEIYSKVMRIKPEERKVR
jgi:hypothetical protein